MKVDGNISPQIIHYGNENYIHNPVKSLPIMCMKVILKIL
jgi:hypothetical protein